MGAHHFDVEKFGCDWAYTVDGGDLGDLEYENFNAAGAKIHIKGVSVHTGYAKGKMVNASRLAVEFQNMIPENETPEADRRLPGLLPPHRHREPLRGGQSSATSSATTHRNK